MKKILVIFAAILISIAEISAQVPNAISYQSVVRNASGQIIPNQTVGVKISILQDNVAGATVYSETFTPTTNAFGQLLLAIGQGTPASGNFSLINWSTGIYFIKVEIDPTGGTSYTLSAVSQLQTVPYSKYSDMAGALRNDDAYAKTANLAAVALSGKYSDLQNLPSKYLLDSVVVCSSKFQTDSLNKYLSAGYRTFVLQAGHTYTFKNVSLPSNTTFIGNGATVIPDGTSNRCFSMTDVSNIVLRDINFVGQVAGASGSSLNTSHVAVFITRCQDILINGCGFRNWLGAGIVSQGSSTSGYSYFNYRMIISNNRFDQCFFGISIAEKSEYGMFSNNILSSCRVGTWHSSGNWNITGNTYVTCRAPYLSYGKTSPYGSLSSDNWNHGSFVGNIMNHANSGGYAPWGAASFLIGGAAVDPVGVVINNVLPPTFSANTLYYTNLDFTGVTATSTGTPWNMTGCVFSQMTITASTPGTVALVGCSKQANVTVNGNVIEQQTLPTTAITTKTTDYALTDADRTIIAGVGCANITLPAATNRKGKDYIIKNNSSNAIGVVSAGGTIDGGASFSIDGINTHGITVQSDGTNWYILSKF